MRILSGIGNFILENYFFFDCHMGPLPGFNGAKCIYKIVFLVKNEKKVDFSLYIS